MNTIEKDIKILKNIPYGRSNKNQADRLKMSLEDYLERKHFLLNQQSSNVSTIKDNYIATLEDKITEQSFNLEKGTGIVKGVLTTEPMSPNEIEIRFKIDTSKWKLSTYWNKAQPNGSYLVSANITLKKSSDREVVLEDAIAAVKAVFNSSAITPYTYMQGTSNKKSLMVYTSDKHVGAAVPENALYINIYNADSFAERMKKLSDEIFYLETIYGKFENIYILDLGDALDGWNGQTTRGGHHLPQNMSNRQSFEVYLKAHKDFFDQLVTAQIANHYHFKAVTCDNHSSDFGYITNRALEEYLNLKFPQMTTQILSRLMEHFVLGVHTFILAHGKDDQDMKFGMPLHLNDKTVNFIDNYIYQNDINPKTTTVHLIKGDLHQDCSESSTQFRYRNTSSMFGSSKWAFHNYLPQGPGVSFDIVEDNKERVFEYTLKFAA